MPPVPAANLNYLQDARQVKTTLFGRNPLCHKP